MQDNIKMIKALSNANGASGFEDEVLKVAKSYLDQRYAISEDAIRNLYINESTNDKPVVLLDAHSDEVGLIVQFINPNGTISFLPLGGWVDTSLPSSKVRVLNSEGVYIPGIVAAKPPHFMKDRNHPEAISMADMVVDIGASSANEVMDDFKIKIGAPIVPDVDCTYDEKHHLFLGKAFDCRIGVAALIATMNRLADKTHAVDVQAVLTSQEEVGERGACVAAKRTKPNIAIVFEGCPADDTFMEASRIQTALGQGPMLRHFDRSMITNPRYQKFVLDLANKLSIPAQSSVRSGGGTNGAMYHTALGATPCIVMGIPVRYIHSHHGFVKYEDFENAVKLAVAIIENITADFIAEF